MQKLTKMRRVAISCNLQSFCRLLLLFWKRNEETEIKSYICISENKYGEKKRSPLRLNSKLPPLCKYVAHC